MSAGLLLGGNLFALNIHDVSIESIWNGPEVSMRLKIPKIGVDAAIEQVALANDGTMDVPTSPLSVAWFELGSRPGEAGSAVIAGHYGWKEGMPAVFDNLSTLQKGDKVYVEDEKGAVTTFVVREIRTYNAAADTTAVFTSTDGKSHLNLITCKGAWSEAEKSYSDRLVVFTDKE